MEYEAVIGLEIHAQLLTDSKAFCSCSTKFGAEPNHNTCQVCQGMPGVLPVLNEKALEFTVRMALACNCAINEVSRFTRKNYYYPDLPKNYQISQYRITCGRAWLGQCRDRRNPQTDRDYPHPYGRRRREIDSR